MTIKENNLTGNFLVLVCVLTNLSQMPYLVENQITRYISIPMWLLFAVYCLYINQWKLYLRGILMPIVLGCFFAIYYFVGQMFIPAYKNSELVTPIFMCIFILLVGSMVGSHLNEKHLQNVGTAYIWSGICVAANVFITYIYGNSLSGGYYLYASKNSVSQILLTVWILILVFKLGKKGFFITCIYIIAFGFITFCMLALKSRATIIGMPIVLIGVLLSNKRNRKSKCFVIAILVVMILLLMQEDIYNTFVNDILFAGRDTSSLESISSGRSSEWSEFWNDIKGFELFGQGRNKRESLILTSLLEFGFLGGSIILLLAIYPIYYGIKYIKKTNPWRLCFILIAITYAVNGIFEQLAPFGPGVKCYFLWLLFGIMTSLRIEREKDGNQ